MTRRFSPALLFVASLGLISCGGEGTQLDEAPEGGASAAESNVGEAGPEAAAPGQGTLEQHEEMAREGIAVMEEMAQVLTKVTDKASAEEHAPALEALISKMKEMRGRMAVIGEPSREIADQVGSRVAADLQAATALMGKEMQRTGMDPEIMAVLGPVVREMGR